MSAVEVDPTMDKEVVPTMDKELAQSTTVEDHGIVATHNGTYRDAQEMYRLGKKQEFKRNFRFISILGFTCTLMATWEAMIATSAFGLIDGGLAGVIWVFLGTVVFFSTMVCSMADMASMAPTSGGQYHWVSEFAPPSTQKFLSYMVGWLSALGWQAGTASTAYLAGTMILGLINLNYPSYTPTQWQGTLITIAVALVATFFNTYGASQLPTLEGLILVLHIFGFFAILIPLWVLAPKNPASKVFGEFNNGGEWPSIGTACIIGQIAPVFAFVGPDSAVHMSEEIKDASKIVPRCMIWTALLNASMGFVMIITYCFCITDLEAALGSTTGYPFIDVFYSATGSKGGATAMACIIVVLIICACISILATASRQTFAFARDNGLPFSPVFGKVTNRTGLELPLNAVLISLTITIIIALINIGSTAAFNSVVSLLVTSLFVSYFISISCILLKRLRGEPLPPSRWSMGRAAIPMNIIALFYIAFACIMSMFPIFYKVTPVNMNWSVLVLGFVTGLATILYFVRGRKVYEGPVTYIKSRELMD
ncbi:MAG: hypothetical protein M1825_003290 [Sarcosagium campestre]|nr:MAG: hypothetical protein M1825_003290 [Sarcosagium campestre]